MAITRLDANTLEILLQPGCFVLLFTETTFCDHIKEINALFENASEQHTGIGFFYVDTDVNHPLAELFGVRSTPVLFGFKDGEHVFEYTGLPAYESLNLLLSTLKTKPSPDSHCTIVNSATHGNTLVAVSYTHLRAHETM
jgi:thiol-disulfide isomerase/thioredoxin